MQPRARSALLAVVLAAACRHTAAPEAVIHTAHGPVRVSLEVAATSAAQQRGLMYRRDLGDDHGMLFVFPSEQYHVFWMKDTFIPLDMVFIGGDGRIVGIHPNATPLSTDPIDVRRPSRWVLEVPGGYAARRGIAPGDPVELPSG